MKYIYIIALFLSGIIFQTVAYLFKILHAPNADLLFKISGVLIIILLLIAIIKVVAAKDKESFLNK